MSTASAGSSVAIMATMLGGISAELLVGVDLDMRALDLGELAYLDVLTEQSSGFLDGFLHGGVTGGCCQNLIHGGCFRP